MNLQRINPQQQLQLRPAQPQQAAVPVPASAEDGPMFRLDIRRALKMHGKLVWSIAGFFLLVAVALVVRKWPLYIATSQVYIQPASQKIGNQSDRNSWPFDTNTYDSFVQQQVQSIANPTVLLSAVHRIDGWQKSGESDQDATDRLGRAIKAARIGSTYEIEITASTKNAAQSASAANAVAASLVEWSSGEATAGNTERVKALTDERDRVQKELDDDRVEQRGLNNQLGMAAVGASAPDLYDSAIEKTREELIKVQTEHDEAQARYNAFGGGHAAAGALGAQADTVLAGDQGLNSMKSWLYQRRAQLIAHMSNLTPNNPAYKQDADELAQTNKSLESMTSDLRSQVSSRIQEQLRADLNRSSEVESRLNGQLRQMVASAATATPKLQRANDLAVNINRLQSRFAFLDEQLKNLLLQNSVPGALHISVAATVPTMPNVLAILKVTVPIAVMGLVFGLIAGLIAMNLDPRIYLGSDVEQALGVAPLAVIPDFRSISSDTINEFMLRIAAPIEHGCKMGTVKSCVITGVASGAGASTVATRVRDLLEAMGRNTRLAGSTGERKDDARGGQQAEPSQKADCLTLNDTEPLASSAEAEYLARYADCTIVVLESGVTTRHQLQSTAKTLQRLGVPSVGFVLNRVNVMRADQAFKDIVREAEQNVRRRGSVKVRQLEPSWREIAVAEEPALPSPAKPSAAASHEALPLQAPKAFVPEPALHHFIPQVPQPQPQKPAPAAEEHKALMAAVPSGPMDSRLSGLRSIDFIRGLRNMNQPADAGPKEQQRELQAIPAPVAPAPRPPAPEPVVAAPEPQAPRWQETVQNVQPPVAPVPVALRPSGAVPTITTMPEFLPPRVTEHDKGHEHVWGSDMPRWDRGTDDDGGILPSWRGQYR